METIISKGNAKLGKHFPNVSMTPIKACRNCKECKTDCYALKSYRMYKEARNAWDNNLRLATEDRAQYFDDISAYIGKKSPRFFRWHVAGDILDQPYCDSMVAIARDNPDVKFLCFTKMYDLDYSSLPENLSVIISAWPGKPFTNKYQLPIAYMQDGTEERVADALECFGDCEHCGICFSLKSVQKNVVFHKH